MVFRFLLLLFFIVVEGLALSYTSPLTSRIWWRHCCCYVISTRLSVWWAPFIPLSCVGGSLADAAAATPWAPRRRGRNDNNIFCFFLLTSRSADTLTPWGPLDSLRDAPRQQTLARRRESRIAKRKPILKVQRESSAREGKILVGLDRPLEFTAPTHHYVRTHSADTPTPLVSPHQHTNIPPPLSARHWRALTPHINKQLFLVTHSLVVRLHQPQRSDPALLSITANPSVMSITKDTWTLFTRCVEGVALVKIPDEVVVVVLIRRNTWWRDVVQAARA